MKQMYQWIGWYLFVTLLMMGIVGYGEYHTQKEALQMQRYMRLKLQAQEKSMQLLLASLHHESTPKIHLPSGMSIVLIDREGMVKEGRLVEPFMARKEGYSESRGYAIYCSRLLNGASDVAFVVVQIQGIEKSLKILQEQMLQRYFFVWIFMGMLFMMGIVWFRRRV